MLVTKINIYLKIISWLSDGKDYALSIVSKYYNYGRILDRNTHNRVCSRSQQIIFGRY